MYQQVTLKTLLFYFTFLSCALAANVTLAWDSIPGATSYRLYWQTSQGTYSLTNIPATSATVVLSPGVYRFAVASVIGNSESPLSDELAYLVQDILPATVSADGKGTVTVSPAIGNVPCPNGLILQCSDDLKEWVNISSFPPPSSPIIIPDPANVPKRFYRLIAP